MEEELWLASRHSLPRLYLKRAFRDNFMLRFSEKIYISVYLWRKYSISLTLESRLLVKSILLGPQLSDFMANMKSMVQELSLQREKFAKNALLFRDSAKGSSFRSRVKVLSGDEGRLTRECKAVIYWMWRDMRSVCCSFLLV